VTSESVRAVAWGPRLDCTSLMPHFLDLPGQPGDSSARSWLICQDRVPLLFPDAFADPPLSALIP